MSWWIIPLKLQAVEAHIHADRRLAFEVLTAFGAKQAGGASTRVLRTDGERRLVEFVTPVGERGRAVTTHEWVSVDPPREIRFSAVKAPLQLLEDRFVLHDADGCTQFRYESTIGVRGWVFGWLIARFYAKPLVERFMRGHVAEMKRAIEERARRSKVYPLPECAVHPSEGDAPWRNL